MSTNYTSWRGTFLLGICLLASAGGCASIGPKTIPRDRYDYSGSVSESWKRQTLLNIVKLRYVDPPIFVDVGQIVAGYSLETGVTGAANLPETDTFGGNSIGFGGSVKYTDRPTVTYTPLTGSKFIKGLVMPLPPDAVFFMIQSGWPADAVLFAAVGSISGLKNQESSIAGVTPPDPKFLRVLALFRQLQLSGMVGMRVKQDPQKQQSTVITFRGADVSEATLADVRELRTLLKLDQEATEFKLVFGATATDDKECAIQTRSLMHILSTMAAQVEVTPEDIAQGRTAPGLESAGAEAEKLRLAHVHSGKEQPENAFVSIRYRGHYFWIDDRDLKSKRAFGFIMFLFTLADTGEKENLPLITIPAQ